MGHYVYIYIYDMGHNYGYMICMGLNMFFFTTY